MNFSKFRRRMSAVVAAGILAGSVGFGANEAQANIFEWTITDWVFEDFLLADVGAIDGTFQFDSSSGLFPVVDLELTGEASGHLDGVTANFIQSLGSSSPTFLASISDGDAKYVLELDVNPSSFAGSYTPANPPIDIHLTLIELCDTDGCSPIIYLGEFDEEKALYYSSVELASSVVPVPAALPLFGTGLAIMGFLGWRRKSKAAAA